MNLFLLLLYCQKLAPEQAVAAKQYLTAANHYQAEAHQLNKPESLRHYTVLLTEYYSSQVGWRTFFLKDLREGERLSELRVTERTITAGSIGEMTTRNLEALLLSAQKRYPNDFNIRFAIANYIFRGQCCQASPKIEMSPKQALAVFEEGDKLGIRTAGSMLALALGAERSDNPSDSLAYYKKGLDLMPEDVELSLGYANALLREKQYDKAIEESRKLFELALSAELKADALLVAARGQYGLGNYSQASATASRVDDIVPGHAFALHIALDALRKTEQKERYAETIQKFLDHKPEDPAPFQNYMNYLRLRDMNKMDLFFMKRYRKAATKTPMEEIVKHVNLGSFASYEKHLDKALAHFKEAREKASQVENISPGIISFLDTLIKNKPESL